MCVCSSNWSQEDGHTKALSGADLMCAHANSYLETLQRFQELQATLAQSLKKQKLRGADCEDEKAEPADTSIVTSDLDEATLVAACNRQLCVMTPAESFHGALFQLFLTETDAIEQSIVESGIPVENQRAERVARVQALPFDLFKKKKLYLCDGATGAPLTLDRQEAVGNVLENTVALHFLLLKQVVFSPFLLPEHAARLTALEMVPIPSPTGTGSPQDESPEHRLRRLLRANLSANQVSWVGLGLGLCRLWAPSSALANLNALQTMASQVYHDVSANCSFHLLPLCFSWRQ
jgi:hypothetical protein